MILPAPCLIIVWQIVEMMNFLYCLGMILEIGAFAALRFSQRDLPRPYRFVPMPIQPLPQTQLPGMHDAADCR